MKNFKTIEMRRAVTIFFSLICLTGYAQEIDATIFLDNGSVVDNSHKFLDGETPTFRLRDNDEGKNFKWALNISLNKAEELQVLETNRDSDRFTFTISPELFPSCCADCKKIELEGDSSVYLRGTVKLYKGDEAVANMPILFNVLPSRPTVIKASLNGDFDFQSAEYIPFAELDVLLASARAEQCFISQVMSDSMYVTQFPEKNYWVTSPVDRFDTIGDIHEVEYQHADWGQYYVFSVSNKYGGVVGDTLFSTDCISDENIINSIKSLYEKTSIPKIGSDMPCISFCKNQLIIEGYTGDDITTSIYTYDGKPVFTNALQRIFDLNFLAKGVYIVRVVGSDKNTITKKIIKS